MVACTTVYGPMPTRLPSVTPAFLHESITPCESMTSLPIVIATSDAGLRASRTQPLLITARSPIAIRLGCISVTLEPK